MIKNIKKRIVVLCRFLGFVLIFVFPKNSFAQTLPVGLFETVEEAYRRQQLLGNDTSNASYMIRPLFINSDNLHLLNDSKSLTDFRKELFLSKNRKSAIYALPITWQNQYNTKHPYGMNDGLMVPARGYQTQFSAGVFAKLGPLSVQLRPEFVFAENKDFIELHEIDNGAAFAKGYAKYYNKIDLPERFGSGSYTKLGWGQSSIRLTFDPVSFGISNENLWWGPGVRNSLLMSNNAPGFKHLTLNTSKPIKTYIGTFEAQIIAGRLEKSGIDIPDGSLFSDKPDNWRYLSAIVVTWQPKWVPNLYFGFDRSFITYRKDMGKKLGDYLPIFSSLEKVAYGDPDLTDNALNEEDLRKRDQYISAFARWVMPESHTEMYFQFGRNDHAYDIRDAVVMPEHSRAYIVGLRKLIPLHRANEFIEVMVEFTQMEGSPTGNVRAQPSWYVHNQVKAGYTNMGQVLGAGIGPGSNLQSLNLGWVKGLNRIGLQLERIAHNNDFFYDSGAYGIRNHWIDLALSGKYDVSFRQFMLNSSLTYIRSLNYQYAIKNGETFWNWNKQDANNLQFKVGVLYNF